MTQDDIVSMAMLARIKVRGYYDESGSTPQELERFANLVAAAEREACAKLCFQMWNTWTDFENKSNLRTPDSEDCAAAIRARGQV